MSNAWDLIKAGEFSQACLVADEESTNSGSILPMRNKVIALLNLHKYDEVITLSNLIIQRNNGETDTDSIFLGVAHWLKGQHIDAMSAWHRATKTNYTDAAGGVEAYLLLFYASVRDELIDLKNDSLKTLLGMHKSAEKIWPGPIAGYVSGRITESELREKISSQPILRAKQTCQAAFYIALMNLIDSKPILFQQRMQESAMQGSFSLTKQEYYLANLEIGNSS